MASEGFGAPESVLALRFPTRELKQQVQHMLGFWLI